MGSSLAEVKERYIPTEITLRQGWPRQYAQSTRQSAPHFRSKALHQVLEIRPLAQGIELAVVLGDPQQPSPSPGCAGEGGFEISLGDVELAGDGEAAGGIVAHR